MAVQESEARLRRRLPRRLRRLAMTAGGETPGHTPPRRRLPRRLRRLAMTAGGRIGNPPH